MPFETVGVVAIGRNEGQRLVCCLKSLRGCTGTLVYVDSGSTDRSVEAAADLGARVVRLDMDRPFTAARARNAGYDALKGSGAAVEFVQFVDGDCELDRNWMDAAVAFLQQHRDVAVVCGRRRERFPEASVYNRLCDDEWNTPVGEATACGGDALVRADALDAVGGFNAALIAGEEPELCVRLRAAGWKIWRLDAEMTLHDAAITRFRDWWRRNVRAGHAFAEVSRLHRGSRCGIWGREVRRAVLWAGVLPVLILCGALIHPAALLALALYPLQVVRIALRRDWKSAHSWTHATFLLLGKFAELQGIAKYFLLRLRGRTARLIEYK
jgi:glycosyltransferase involved in cell wall biosynthesis